MAEEKIQKAIIEMKDLPPVSNENTYVVRYRVVSDDKNLSTEWSEPLKVYASNVANVSGSLQLSSNKDIVSIVWGDENNRPAYDVFVRFGDSPTISDTHWQSYFYHGTSLVHNYSILIPSTNVASAANASVTVAPHYATARIQVASSSKTISDALDIYELATPLHLV